MLEITEDKGADEEVEDHQTEMLLVPVRTISMKDRNREDYQSAGNNDRLDPPTPIKPLQLFKKVPSPPPISDPHLDEEAMFAAAINLRRLFCNLCNRKMASRKSLNTHYKLVHIKHIHTCRDCGMSFLFSKFLDQHHAKRKRIIPCPKCELKFCSNKRYSSHMEKHHPPEEEKEQSPEPPPKRPPPRPIVQEPDKFPCKDCGKIFLTQNYLHSHWGKRSNVNFRFECAQCKHRFSKESILKDHLEYHKRNAPVIPPPSPVKLAPAPPSRRRRGAVDQDIDFEKHITKMADSTFKCNFCQRNFNKISHVKCHLRYVHLKKSFNCRICKTEFPYYKLFVSHTKSARKCQHCNEKLCVKVSWGMGRVMKGFMRRDCRKIRLLCLEDVRRFLLGLFEDSSCGVK